MIELVCTSDRLRYNRRDLRAEDPFDAVSRQDARVLVAAGHARYAAGEPPPEPARRKKRTTKRKKKTAVHATPAA
jgi:hypothetical protein